MQLTALAAAALLAQNAAAQFNMLRFACSQLGMLRLRSLHFLFRPLVEAPNS